MAATCVEAESAINYHKLYQGTRNTVMLARTQGLSTSEAIASSAVKTCIEMNAKMMVVLTETGRTARLVAKYRPEQRILVMTSDPRVARVCEGVLRGITARVVESMAGTDSILLKAASVGKDLGWVTKGDTLVAIHGMNEQVAGVTNLLKVLVVP